MANALSCTLWETVNQRADIAQLLFRLSHRLLGDPAKESGCRGFYSHHDDSAAKSGVGV